VLFVISCKGKLLLLLYRLSDLAVPVAEVVIEQMCGCLLNSDKYGVFCKGKLLFF
jgi:hypothetical protein